MNEYQEKSVKSHYKDMYLRVGGFIETSTSDGPGLRSVLFLQGCHRGCKGCQNQKLSNPANGVLMPMKDAVEYVVDHCKNRKLTISGGEPLEQLPTLIVFTELLSNLGFDICVYTGYEWEDVPLKLRKNLHWIKVGDYQKEKRTITKPFVGSLNQRMLELDEEGELKYD